MSTFLENLAGKIIEKHRGQTASLVVVLPNRRGGLFLKQQIAMKAGENIWSPRIVSIEDLVCEISGLNPRDPLSLLFDLYHVHVKCKGEMAQSFEDFLQWGQGALQDFNDIDLYLADAQQVFTYLNASKAMSLWNPDGRPLSEMQLSYLDFFNTLSSYYKDLQQSLLERKQGYNGLIFRTVAENQEMIAHYSQERHYIFAGFNALSSSEEKIIRSFLSNGNSEIYWDSDNYYLKQEIQEAGSFLRKVKKEWKLNSFEFATDHFKTEEKEISIYGLSGNTAQAKFCGQILNELSPEELSTCCVVLVDESMLIPTLNSIPAGAGSFNVTMGFPLSLTPVSTLFDALFRMHENSLRLSGDRYNKNAIFHLENILEVLLHPYMLRIGSNEANDGGINTLLKIANKLRENYKILFTRDELETSIQEESSKIKESLSPLFSSWETEADTCISVLKGIILTLKEHFPEESGVLDREYLFQHHLLLNRLHQQLLEYQIKIPLPAFFKLLRQACHSATIPFYGEPLAGLQVMGLLETRTLDFDKLILLSANDDLLPGAHSSSSYIPYDIRVDFGLPTYKHKESVSAYHFYRLLQRASRAWLLYNADGEQMGGGERSRYLSQIIEELPSYNSGIHIEEKIFSFSPKLKSSRPQITIQKSPAVMDLIRKRAARGFAPSSLNNYLNCSLKFYFQELAQIEEPDELNENMDNMEFGSALHSVLEKLFTPYKGKKIKSSELQQMKDGIPDLVDEALAKQHPGGDFRYGKNLLLMKIAQVYLRKYLDFEIEEVSKPHAGQLEILDLEKPLRHELAEGEWADCPIVLKGIADRIDLFDQHLRIIDYKTGKTIARDLKLDDTESLFQKEKGRDKCFQLLMYAYLYKKEFPKSPPLKSGIYSLHDISQGFLCLNVEGQDLINEKVLLSFESMLEQMVREIFDKAQVFTQTEDTNQCRNCPYSKICYRS